MKRSEILVHVAIVRSRLEKMSAVQSEPLIHVIGAFPQSFCQNSARLLCRYFHEVHGVSKDELTMCVNAESEDGLTHAWCIICGFHVDITADQFEGGLPLIVEEKHPMIGYFSDPDTCDYDESQNINLQWREIYYEPLFQGIKSA